MMAGLENTGGTEKQARVAERNRAQPVFCLIAWPRRRRLQPHRRCNGTSERIDCGKRAGRDEPQVAVQAWLLARALHAPAAPRDLPVCSPAKNWLLSYTWLTVAFA
ncbi:hypothetical protein [Paraburkholderia sp. ZP32-5]|uniref:hypothetical protein n=1 Tax=Paraburkholderia sp. ZP32-5 TaxID=2883245 RepID=UPI001F268AEA|nr:hypothetical protein [Paraburkholderia sp. ZP32-5]